MNTYVTHPWIALEETTNAVMLLNFGKIYFPVAPEVRRIQDENREVYVRSEVIITPNGKAITSKGILMAGELGGGDVEASITKINYNTPLYR